MSQTWITHHRLDQVISLVPELADSLVDVDLALLLELLDERVDGDEGAGAADAGGAVHRDGSVLPRLVDAFDESEKSRKLLMVHLIWFKGDSLRGTISKF